MSVMKISIFIVADSFLRSNVTKFSLSIGEGWGEALFSM